MATEHGTDAEPDAATPFETDLAWRAGALAGLTAALAMGVAITATDLGVIRSSIAGLYGFEGSLAVGWLAHLFHGTLFGALFAVVLTDPGLHRVEESPPKTVLAGLAFGLGLAVVATGFVMPVWLGVVGVGSPPGVPFLTAGTVGWHLVYGLALGATFPYVAR
jgi:hypothetical protein